MERYIRAKQVAELLSIGVSTVWLWSKNGLLKPIKLTDKVTVWSTLDIQKFIEDRIKENS